MGACEARVPAVLPEALKRQRLKLAEIEVPSDSGSDSACRSSSSRSSCDTERECPNDPSSVLAGCNRSLHIHYQKCRIKDMYSLDSKLLGEGTSGSVCKGTCKLTGAVRAIKMIPRGDVADVAHEIGMLKLLHHPNIIKLFYTFEDSESIYMVMELCAGGDVFEQVARAGRLSEREAAIVMQQLFRAVFYMHENNIAHRDLKPDNILLLTAQPIEDNIIKVIDFGLSCLSEPDDVHSEVVGTPHYIAPQVHDMRYDRRCDLWSCGVVMYVILAGRTPFSGRHPAEIQRKVCEGKFGFHGSVWEEVSADAQHLIRLLLEMRPEQRYTAQQALSHDWIRLAAVETPTEQLQEGSVEQMRDFT
mmetsp:Transcript_120923/g.353283  ORF Transcript_120923/g.353283 Transcript_120923/m.353283 type:complete len:360 (+) Transcript_120923:57-1136(+)